MERINVDPLRSMAVSFKNSKVMYQQKMIKDLSVVLYGAPERSTKTILYDSYHLQDKIEANIIRYRNECSAKDMLLSKCKDMILEDVHNNKVSVAKIDAGMQAWYDRLVKKGVKRLDDYHPDTQSIGGLKHPDQFVLVIKPHRFAGTSTNIVKYGPVIDYPEGFSFLSKEDGTVGYIDRDIHHSWVRFGSDIRGNLAPPNSFRFILSKHVHYSILCSSAPKPWQVQETWKDSFIYQQ